MELTDAQGTVPASPVTKILDNGPDGERLVFAVLGDGYALGDEAKYRDDVDRLLLNGVFSNDGFGASRLAFNMYRVDLVSSASGVSTPDSPKDTALQLVFNGVWDQCWINEAAGSDALILAALRTVPKYDYVLLLLNDDGFGGCRRGMRMYFTRGVEWPVVSHECGHGVGNLFDEYWPDDAEAYTGGPINTRNCSTVVDRSRVAWSRLILPETPIPTTFGAGMNPSRTVGMFEGAKYCVTGIYRPVDDCRMRTNTPSFCPVCEAVLQTAVGPYLPKTFAAAAQQSTPEDERMPGDDAMKQNDPQTEMSSDQPGADGHVHLVIRLTNAGEVTVLSATELAGQAVLRPPQMSRFGYEVTRGNETVAVEALPEDPFVVRSFPDPVGGRGHHFDRANEATIAVKVPSMSVSLLGDAAQAVGLRVYELAQEPNDAAPLAAFDAIRRAGGGVRVIAEVPASELSAQVSRAAGGPPR